MPRFGVEAGGTDCCTAPGVECRHAQVLVESARRLPRAGMFEQGAGALQIVEAYHALRRYTPRASLIPPKLDFGEPYMWPYVYQVGVGCEPLSLRCRGVRELRRC